MTFQKLLTDHYKNRLWLVVLTALGSLIHYVLIPALFLGGYKVSVVTEGNKLLTVKDAMQIAGAEWFNFSLIFGMLEIILLAAITGIQEFSYLYKNNSVDFYDSQPVAFRSRFIINYASGIIMFAVIYAIGMIFGLAVITACGSGCPALYTGILESYLWFLILYAGIYSFAVLGAVVSGNLFIAFLAGCFISGIEFLFRIIIFGGMAQYFTTMYHIADSEIIRPRSLPLAWYFSYIGDVLSADVDKMEFVTAIPKAFISSGKGMAVCLVVACIACTLAYVAFINRPREAVEKGLCFPILESFVKISLGILGGILTGTISDMIFSSVFSFSVMTFVVIAVVIALICLVGEWIFSLNITKVFNKVWQIPLCIIAAFAVIIIFKQDAFGYDSYVPGVDQIESFALYTQDNYSYSIITTDEEGRGINQDREEYLRNNLSLTDAADVVEVAKIGMKERRKLFGRDSTDFSRPQSWSVTVLYRMKNGRQIWRQMEIPYDIDHAPMDNIIGSNEYKDVYFDLNKTIEGLKDAVSFDTKGRLSLSYNTAQNNETASAEIDDVKALFKAYEKDLNKYDFSYSQGNVCIGTVDVNFAPVSQGMSAENLYRTLPVYEGYDNTIKALKEKGLFLDPLPDIENVSFVIAQYDKVNENGELERSETARYDEKDKISELLDSADINCYGDWSRYSYSMEDISAIVLSEEEIAEAGDTDDPDYYWNHDIGSTYTIRKENIPDFVKTDLGL